MIKRYCDRCSEECSTGWFEFTLKERASESEFGDAMKFKRTDETLCRSCADSVTAEFKQCQHQFWTNHDGIHVCNECQMTIDPREE